MTFIRDKQLGSLVNDGRMREEKKLNPLPLLGRMLKLFRKPWKEITEITGESHVTAEVYKNKLIQPVEIFPNGYNCRKSL